MCACNSTIDGAVRRGEGGKESRLHSCVDEKRSRQGRRGKLVHYVVSGVKGVDKRVRVYAK